MPNLSPDDLSRQQLAVATRFAEGKTTKEIGLELGVSSKTIEYHRTEAYKRLGIDNVVHLAHWALAVGLINNRYSATRETKTITTYNITDHAKPVTVTTPTPAPEPVPIINGTTEKQEEETEQAQLPRRNGVRPEWTRVYKTEAAQIVGRPRVSHGFDRHGEAL